MVDSERAHQLRVDPVAMIFGVLLVEVGVAVRWRCGDGSVCARAPPTLHATPAIVRGGHGEGRGESSAVTSAVGAVRGRRARGRSRVRRGSHGCPSSRCTSGSTAVTPRCRCEAGRVIEVAGRLGVGDSVHHVILVRREIDLRDVRVCKDSRLAEEEVARACRGETSFLGEGGGEDVDGKGAAQLRDVTVGVPIVRESQ